MQLLAARLNGAEPFDEVYTSPLERTRETAEPLAAAVGCDVIALDDLGELLFGSSGPSQSSSSSTTGCALTPSAGGACLYSLWLERNCEDAYIGSLVNAYIARGGYVTGYKAGRQYFDVGTLDGYRQAMRALDTLSAGAARLAEPPSTHRG